MTSATFCNVSIIFFMSITLFGLFYISAKFYWQQTSITRDIEGRLNQPPPPGPEEPLKSPVHIGLNQLGSVAVKTLVNSSFHVYCVNAHYYTKNNSLCSINILPHSNKLLERSNLKKSATIFYQH